MSDNTPVTTLPAVGVRSFAPQTFADALKFAHMLSQSAFVPKDFRGKDSEILAAIQYGAELGVGPMQALQNIAVINGKPSVYGDMALALVQASGLLEYIKESDDGTKATCTVKRKGDQHEHVVDFSNEDAKRAGLFGKQGPWTQYPKRMRMFRARGFALRDKFADVLKGLITREEAEDYPVTIESAIIDPLPSTPLDEPPAVLNLSNPNDKASPQQRQALAAAAAKQLGDKSGEWLVAKMKELGCKKRDDLTIGGFTKLMKELAEMPDPARGEEPQDDGSEALAASFDE